MIAWAAGVLTEASAQPAGGAAPAQIEASFQKALRYERHGNLSEALEIYLDLMGTPEIRSRAYESAVRVTISLERWATLETLASERLREDPEDMESRLHLGRSLAHQDRVAEARSAWKAAVKASAGQPDVVERVARYALEAGMLDDAVASFLEVRKRSGIPALYAPDVANLYLRQDRVEPAIDEFLLWLKAHPEQSLVVEGELRRVLWNPDVREEAKKLLSAAVRDRRGWTDLNRIVVELWVETGWCGEALELAVGAESPWGGAALSLVRLGDRCREKGCTQEAIQAYRRASEGPSGDRRTARVRLGRLLMEQGREDEAAAEFEQFLEEFPSGANTPDVLYDLGQALLRMGRCEEGLRHLRVLIRDFPLSPRLEEARFLAAECLIGLGRLDDVAGELGNASVEDLGPAGEPLLFRRGEILFLAGRFDEALQDYQGIIHQFPRGRYVNDALSRVLLITKNRVAGDEALVLYSSALYFKRLHQWSRAAARLDSLVYHFSEGSLIEEALLARAEVERDAGDPNQAIRTLDRLLSGNPDSRFAPRALVMKGDLYIEQLDDTAGARRAYETALMQYPDCPLADGVRRKLRVIEEALP